MGVIGAVAGASSTGVITLIKSMMDNSFHRKVSEADRRLQVVASLRSQRDTSIKLWRVGLEHARDAYRRSLEQTPDGSAAPNVVGDEWFETLRPHLAASGDGARYRTATDVRCDNPTVAALSLEIGRIEQQWLDEAKG
jgi:protein involved in temperature-dependent protein secretion